MPRRDPALEDAIREIAALLAEAYLRLLLGKPAVDFPERERALMGRVVNAMEDETTRIHEEIESLRQMSVGQLKEKYREVFGEETRSNHKQFLFRRIAWRIQANAWGGLSERARRRALEIANDADLRIRAPKNFLREPADNDRTTEARVKLSLDRS